MYWTGYGDASKLKREEVEEKWKVIKASPGARYIKYVAVLYFRNTLLIPNIADT